MSRRRSRRGKEPVAEATEVEDLVVKPMLEISGDKPERWGLFDDEMYAKKVEYMVRLIGEGHLFSKAHWGGGDANDKLYVYSEKVKVKKRKAITKAAGPVLKQRRMSSYYNRQVTVDAAKFAEMAEKIEEHGKEMARLREVYEKQERQWKKWKMLRKGGSLGKWRSGTKLRMKVRAKESQVAEEFRADMGVPSVSGEDVVRMNHGSSSVVGCEEITREMSGDGLDAREIGELGVLVKAVVADNEVCDSMNFLKNVCEVDLDIEKWKMQIDKVEEDGTGNMNEGETVHNEGLNENEADNGPPQDGRDSMKTDVVEENELEGTVSETNMGLGKDISEVDGGSEHGSENGEDDRMMGDVEEKLSTDRRMVVYTGTTYLFGEHVEGGNGQTGESMKDDDAGEKVRSIEENEEGSLGETPQMAVEEVSDSSPPTTVTHRPGEEDEQLAALLLAKDQYSFPDIVPFYEDCDYPFFEKVLTANQSV
ncbi:unnamed protein product [Eruca vesicaria subsp. sativa]|uniref:Uncharacterized protein n=1 Tax=Eruca vesicaria subsp. sativa TaxID=29727 RepID=A0ABC8LNC8_ERUVS|nr:unnamed protein product [Eruca vesicaria subsp. sativa]